MSESPLVVVETMVAISRSRLFGLEAQLAEFSGWLEFQAAILCLVDHEQQHLVRCEALLDAIGGGHDGVMGE